MNDELAAADISLLRRLESTIQAGKNTFVTVGNALTEIRDKRLYRKDHKTFDEYCEKRWGWTRQRASQIVQATSVVQSLPKNLSTMVDSERVARAVAKVPPERRAAAVETAARNGPVTAVAITKAAKLEVVERKDHIGRVIPKEILEDWDRAHEIASHLRQLAQEIKLTVERGLKENDPIYREVDDDISHKAGGIYSRLHDVLPYCVCYQCQGRMRKNCQLCRERGWISKFMYDHETSDQMKNLLKAGVK